MRAFSSFRFFILLWGGGAAGGWLPPASSSFSSAAAAASAPRLASLRPGGRYRRSAGPRLLLPRRPRGGSPGPAAAARPARAMAARAAPRLPASKPRSHWRPRDRHRPARAAGSAAGSSPAPGRPGSAECGAAGTAPWCRPARLRSGPAPTGLAGGCCSQRSGGREAVLPSGCLPSSCQRAVPKPCKSCHGSRPSAGARHRQPRARCRAVLPRSALGCAHRAGCGQGDRQGERELAAGMRDGNGWR